MKWTKIDQLALGIKFIGEPFNFSSYRVALMKIEIVKKNCSLQVNGRKGFLVVDIILLSTHSDNFLQHMTSTDFCVQIALYRGTGTPSVPEGNRGCEFILWCLDHVWSSIAQ